MKKFIATVAIATIISTVAHANSLEYTYSGSWSSFYGYSFPDNKYKHRDKRQFFVNTFNLNLGADKSFNDDYSLGLYADLMLGIDKRQYDYSNGLWGHELYTIFDNPLGRIMLGETYSVASQFHISAPSVGTFNVNNSDIVNFIANPNWLKDKHHTSYRTLNSTAINTDGTAVKISYIAPEYNNITLGFSYVPDAYSRTGLINRDARYADDRAYIGSVYYHTDLGFAEMESSLGYGIFNQDDKDFSVGLSFYRAGWTIGGSFRKTYVDGNDYSITNNSNNPRLPNLFDNYREGKAWNLGVGYEIGPYEVALSYFESQADNSDNKDKITLLSNAYQINKNFSIYLAGAYAEFDGVDYEQSNEGYSIISGFNLSF